MDKEDIQTFIKMIFGNVEQEEGYIETDYGFLNLVIGITKEFMLKELNTHHNIIDVTWNEKYVIMQDWNERGLTIDNVWDGKNSDGKDTFGTLTLYFDKELKFEESGNLD